MPFHGDFSLPTLHATLYATNQRNGTEDTTDSNLYLFNEHSGQESDICQYSLRRKAP
jgi:hypothetical protein